MSKRIGATRVARLPILAVFGAVLVILGLVDRIGGQANPAPAALVEPVPVAAPLDALSSSWFCGGATDGGSLGAPGEVVVANASSAPAQGVVTILGQSGSKRKVSVTVAGYSSLSVPETLPGGSGWVGAIVDINSGAVAVDQSTGASSGLTETPCASSGSTHWYFASGETLINAGVEITLINPYPTDSIVDLSFTTDQGIEAPEDFQGLDVPGGGILSVDLGSHLRRRQSIATTVSVRSGSVVAFETKWVTPPAPGSVLLGTPGASNPLADPADPTAGVSVTLGAPSVGTSWTWPDGLAGGGIDEQYVIYNPGPSTAMVRLSVGLAQGAAEPFPLTVGPYQVLPIASDQQARIPSLVAHSAVLTSLNGVGVVAERTVVADSSSPYRLGAGDLIGGRISADQWLVPHSETAAHHVADVVLYNPGDTSVSADLYTFSHGAQVPFGRLPTVSVPPGQRALVAVPGSFSGPVLVVGTAPLYAESDIYGASGTSGVSLSFGVPLSS